MSHSPKRARTEDIRQLGFAFDAPPPADRTPGALAGLDRRISGLVGRVLKEHKDPREVVAAHMSALLDDDVSRAMLDQYAAPSSDAHNISAARFFALVLATDRHDLLDLISKTVGATILVGEEARLAMLGSEMAKRQQADKRIEELSIGLMPMVRGQRS